MGLRWGVVPLCGNAKHYHLPHNHLHHLYLYYLYMGRQPQGLEEAVGVTE